MGNKTVETDDLKERKPFFRTPLFFSLCYFVVIFFIVNPNVIPFVRVGQWMFNPPSFVEWSGGNGLLMFLTIPAWGYWLILCFKKLTVKPNTAVPHITRSEFVRYLAFWVLFAAFFGCFETIFYIDLVFGRSGTLMPLRFLLQLHQVVVLIPILLMVIFPLYPALKKLMKNQSVLTIFFCSLVLMHVLAFILMMGLVAGGL